MQNHGEPRRTLVQACVAGFAWNLRQEGYGLWTLRLRGVSSDANRVVLEKVKIPYFAQDSWIRFCNVPGWWSQQLGDAGILKEAYRSTHQISEALVNLLKSFFAGSLGRLGMPSSSGSRGTGMTSKFFEVSKCFNRSSSCCWSSLGTARAFLQHLKQTPISDKLQRQAATFETSLALDGPWWPLSFYDSFGKRSMTMTRSY